jgi:hypothetical protein
MQWPVPETPARNTPLYVFLHTLKKTIKIPSCVPHHRAVWMSFKFLLARSPPSHLFLFGIVYKKFANALRILPRVPCNTKLESSRLCIPNLDRKVVGSACDTFVVGAPCHVVDAESENPTKHSVGTTTQQTGKKVKILF